jgi:predicted AAA+ superfamily ATPase
LVNFLKQNTKSNTKTYVFIDEIQRKENAGLFLKGIYDLKLPYKFIVSGSGSIELKEKISESLAGRKRVFNLGTLSFVEFIDFKTKYRYTINLIEYLKSEFFDESLLNEYLWFGGYPRVVIAETTTEKTREMDEIYESYLNKDLKDLLGVKRSDLITDLLTKLSTQIKSMVNFSDIRQDIKIDFHTLRTYLYYLEHTYVLNRLYPFYRNPAVEITKAPMFVFEDLGMRNYAFNKFSYQNRLTMGGALFENFVYLLLRDGGLIPPQLNYWRTVNKAEVDFIVRQGVDLVPVEVKFKNLKNTNVTRSFSSFINKYQPPKAVVVNLSFNATRLIGQTEVKFVSYLELVKSDVFSL